MRELKFRFWDTTDNRFIDDPLINKNGQVGYYTGTTIDWIDDVIVQQYTGMEDVYETSIYEGDIIEFNGSLRLVRWSNSGGCWEIAPLDKKLSGGFDINDPEEDYVEFNGFDDASLAFNGGNEYNGPIKIIGNIFENPELLK